MVKALAIVIVLVVVFLAGPRVEIDPRVHRVDLPDNLDEFLKGQEGRFSDIVPGTEKAIVWAGGPGIKTKYSIVYIHGFSATRKETAPLSDNVAKALGANLFCTRLTGHGRTGRALAQATVNDWLNDAAEAYEIGARLGENVILIGASTGATAVAWLAHRAIGENGMAALHSCIYISPNFKPADPFAMILTWPWGQQMAQLIIGRERSWEPDAPGHDTYWTNRYPTRALLPMMGLVKLVSGLELSHIRVPCLMIASPDDQIIDFNTVKKVFNAISSEHKQLVPFTTAQDPSRHVLAGDILSPGTTNELARLIVSFVQDG